MPNQTLYINKDNWENFSQEPQRSDLVNLLLSRHYDRFQPGTLIEPSVPSVPLDAVLTPTKGAPGVSISEAVVIKNPKLNHFVCPRCGKIKVSGQCLTKGCRGR